MENLRKLREEKGLTRQEFANKVGVSLTTCQNWEGGATKNIKPEHINKINEVLGLKKG